MFLCYFFRVGVSRSVSMIVYRQRRSLELSNIIQEMSTLSMKDYIIKNHELNKFKLLYLENAPRLIFYASKYVDSDTAEDLVHDIFIKIWQKKEIYSVEEGLKTYLFRSVQNACLDYLKHKSIEMTYADEVARRLKIEEIGYYNRLDAAELEKERLDSVYREIAKLRTDAERFLRWLMWTGRNQWRSQEC